MPTPSEIVTTFLALWEKPDGFPEAVDTYFTTDTVWENHGMITTRGGEEAIGFYDQFSQQTGMAAMKVELRAIAETGNKVLTERIDYVLNEAGETVLTVPVMGIFELEGGLITAWRDYFDTAAGSPPG